MPDVIQYEWQEQYFLQLTATDNIAVLKDIKYTREDYYALYNDTSVDTCIDVNDFVCRLLKKTGSELDVAFYSQFKIDSNLVNLANLKLSEYSSVDWATFEPKDCYFLLGTLMESLGCVVYQSNKDATWYVVAINDLAVNDLVTDGTFSIDGALPPIYEYCEKINYPFIEQERWFQLDVVWERYTWLDTCDLWYRGGLGDITNLVLSDLTISSGRTDIYSQPLAGYCRFTISAKKSACWCTNSILNKWFCNCSS